jgi:hypothetical protein
MFTLERSVIWTSTKGKLLDNGGNFQRKGIEKIIWKLPLKKQRFEFYRRSLSDTETVDG